MGNIFFSSSLERILPANTTAYWRFNESSGNALDSKGSHTLTQTGTISSANGKLGLARGVFSTSNYFTTSQTDFQKQYFLIMGWINIAAGFSDFNMVVSTVDTDNITYLGWGLDVNSSEKVRLVGFSGNGSVQNYSVTSTTSLTPGTWYHVAAYIRSLSAGDCAIYVNGVSEATAQAMNPAPDGNAPLTIGTMYRNTGYVYGFNGLVDSFIYMNLEGSPYTAGELATIIKNDYNYGYGIRYAVAN